MGLYGPYSDTGNDVLARMVTSLGLLIEQVMAGATPATGSVTDAKVAADAAIAQSKIANLVADLAARATDAELAAGLATKQDTIPSGTYPESAILTTNGDLLTRAAGVPARTTRAALAADSAFTAAFPGNPLGVPAVGVVLAAGLDATGVSNMAATMVAQMTALSAAGGGRYRLPIGTFLGENVTIPSKVILEGSGPGTIIKLRTGAVDHLIRGGGTDGGIDNLTLECNAVVSAAGGGSLNALCPTLAVGFQVGTIWVKNPTGDAVLLAGCTDTTIGQVIATGVGRNGLSCESSGATQTVGVTAGLIIARHGAFGTPNAGIDIESGRDIAIGIAIVEGFPNNVVIIGQPAETLENVVIGTLIGKGATDGNYGVLIDGTAGPVDNVEIGSAVFDNPLATGDYYVGPGTTNIRVGKPGSFGIVRPPWLMGPMSPITVRAANYTHYHRVVEGGTISKVRVFVGTASGNISVSAWRTVKSNGVGLSAKPRLRLATSGSVACPPAGSADVALGSSVSLQPGDWISLACDNATATFYGMTGLGGVPWAEGECMSQASSFPSVTDPPGAGGLTADNLAMFAIVGVP